MKMYTMCRHCGRALASAHGLCQLCQQRRIPQRRVVGKPITTKKTH